MKSRKYPIFAGISFGLLIAILLVGVDFSEQRRYQEQLRTQVIDQLSQIRAKLETEINADFYLTRGLIAYVATHPQLSQTTFHLLARNLLQQHSHIRNIGLAPDNVLKFIYPVSGNETALGLNYEQNKEQWPAVKAAIDARITVVAGPVNLVQGGSAFISRTPIYISNENLPSNNHYWGLASIVIDQDKLLKNTGFFDKTTGISVAIRGKDGRGEDGEIFAGDATVFFTNPVLLDVNLPEGSWQLAAVPMKGWNQLSPYHYPVLAGGLSLAILVGFFVYGTTIRQIRKREALEAAHQEVLKAKSALEQNYNQQKSILNSIDANVFVTSLENGTVLFMNQHMIEEFGVDFSGEICSKEICFSKKTQAGQTIHQFNHQGQNTDHHMWECEIPATGKSYLMHERAIIWQDGHKARLQIATDISEVRRLENELRQKHKMEAVGYMAGGIAHNFNNSLAAILGSLEMSKRRRDRPDQILHYIETAQKAALRARDLISQILTYSRSDGNELKATDIAQVIEETLTLLKSTLPVTVDLNYQNSLPPATSTIANPSQIQEVLLNLCTNAVHAMDESGTIAIRLDLCQLAETDIPKQFNNGPGSYIQLTISDTGCGIPTENLDKIFDPFFTTKDVGVGTGMGLATVQGIIHQHKAIIKVDSSVSKGATFTIFFSPSIRAPQAEERIAAPAEQHQGHEKILLVDDDEMLLDIHYQILNSFGYEVTAERDGKTAFKLFAEDPSHYDLVISDQTMPELTGKDLLTEMKKIRPDLHTILITGYSSKIDQDEAHKLGIDAFCMKPIAVASFAETIRRVLGTKQ